MNVDFDTVVVGAGVVGLAIAQQLSLDGLSVLVLEKAERAGTETSSRNSAVIHAGVYYPTGSLKAQFCVKGRKLLREYCCSHGVEVRFPGKLIVATSNKEEVKLKAISLLARANGVDDLKWMTGAEVSKLEPEVRCTCALYSPSTGIIDASGFMLALQAVAEARDVTFVFNTSFVASKKQDAVFVVTTSDKSGKNFILTCRTLINSAGHGAHDVVTGIQGYPLAKRPPRYLAKGNYCTVSGANPFKHLIYPVPVSGALGIHATFDLAGTLRLGPDIQWTEAFDYSMPSGLPENFEAAVHAYWPGVKDRSLTSSYCGVRPKIHGPNEVFADFNIQQHTEHGVDGLINLFGIESPGLTASLAIAEYIGDSLRNFAPSEGRGRGGSGRTSLPL
jgi:L-2-hydroxyglutarate oxidase LhgO